MFTKMSVSIHFFESNINFFISRSSFKRVLMAEYELFHYICCKHLLIMCVYGPGTGSTISLLWHIRGNVLQMSHRTENINRTREGLTFLWFSPTHRYFHPAVFIPKVRMWLKAAVWKHTWLKATELQEWNGSPSPCSSTSWVIQTSCAPHRDWQQQKKCSPAG